jgi:aminoglycoside phosphotransferase (APT) family kinase protein
MTEFEFTSKELINKGWSGDKKYCVTSDNGTKYLLRQSPAKQYERKKTEFAMMKRVASLGVPMCRPVTFGTCEDGVYSLQSWIEGVEAEEVIPTLPDVATHEF